MHFQRHQHQCVVYTQLVVEVIPDLNNILIYLRPKDNHVRRRVQHLAKDTSSVTDVGQWSGFTCACGEPAIVLEQHSESMNKDIIFVLHQTIISTFDGGKTNFSGSDHGISVMESLGAALFTRSELLSDHIFLDTTSFRPNLIWKIRVTPTCLLPTGLLALPRKK